MYRTPYRPCRLADKIGRLISPALRRRGFVVSEILLHWPAIVGERLAAFTCPDRVAYPPTRGARAARGTKGAEGAALRLRVAPGHAPEVQHLAPLIVERINAYYGYGAIARLQLMQGPVPPAPGRTPAPLPPRLNPVAEKRLATALAGMADGDLHDALARFGRRLLAATETTAQGAIDPVVPPDVDSYTTQDIVGWQRLAPK